MQFNLATLKESNEFLNMIMSSITSAVFLADEELRIHHFNDPFAAMFGQKADEIIGMMFGKATGCTFSRGVQLECRDDGICQDCELKQHLRDCITGGECAKHQILEREFSGETGTQSRFFRYSVNRLTFQGATMAMVVMEDITELETSRIELERLSRILEQQAYLDSLTGVANRRLIMNLLEKEESRFNRSGTEYAILLLDIDNFKQVNDTYGHQAGDEVLEQLSDIFMGKLRSSDTVARYGGEEFLLLLPDTEKQGAMECAELVRSAVEMAFLGSTVGNITISVGIASSTEADSVKELIALADSRLYDAKSAGKNVCVG